MSRRRKIIVSILCSLLVLLCLAFLLLARTASGPSVSPVSITFITFTNDTASLKLAHFEIRNTSPRRVARNGYCRVNDQIVGIMPTVTLLPGQSEILNVPLFTLGLTGSMQRITFNGVRTQNLAEELLDGANELLAAIGIDPLGDTDNNRWTHSLDFPKP